MTRVGAGATKDVQVHGLRLRRREGAELLRDQRPAALVGAQGLRVVACRRLCLHQQAVAALAERLQRDDLLGGSRRGSRIARGEADPRQALERPHEDRAQLAASLVDPRGRLAREERPAGLRRRRGGGRPCVVHRSGEERLLGCGRLVGRGMDVDPGALREAELVAPERARQPRRAVVVALPQHRAQLAHEHRQGLLPRRGRRLAPEHVCQLVPRDGPAPGEDEAREEEASLPALEALLVDDDLAGLEDDPTDQRDSQHHDALPLPVSSPRSPGSCRPLAVAQPALPSIRTAMPEDKAQRQAAAPCPTLTGRATGPSHGGAPVPGPISARAGVSCRRAEEETMTRSDERGSRPLEQDGRRRGAASPGRKAGVVRPLVLALTVAVAATLAFGAARSSSAPGENAVVHWSEVASGAISAGRPPASSSVLAGMVHAAMYDAVAAVEGGLVPFATTVAPAPGASVEAAVATAARDVLVARVPSAQATVVNDAYAAFMGSIPPGPAKDQGVETGAAAAAGMLALRANDHFGDVVAYVQPTPGPGVFEPIAQGVIDPVPPPKPVDTQLPFVQPFTYAGAAYRPDPPFALTSKQYARDVAELQLLGGLTGSQRTAEQTETVRFFSDHTFVQYSRALRGIANERGLDVRESARLLGYAWVAIGDTMIACFEAKYHYLFWRPNHAIQRADTDGNPATVADPAWLPLVTGNHPEYPSGHSCFTAATVTVLHRTFGTKVLDLTVTSTTAGAGGPRTYHHLKDLVADVEDARVWGGLHYRTTVEESSKHFTRIARDVAARFLPAEGQVAR